MTIQMNWTLKNQTYCDLINLEKETVAIKSMEGKLTNEQVYDAEQIQVLEGLEAVGKRPGMYIGSTTQKGLPQLAWEIVDNSIDDARAGTSEHTQVIIQTANTLT